MNWSIDPMGALLIFLQMVANLGGFIEEKGNAVPAQIDLPGFTSLVYLVASHESLAVSIPAMNLWTKFLRSDKLSQKEAIQQFTPQLLELATARLIRVIIHDTRPRGSLLTV